MMEVPVWLIVAGGAVSAFGIAGAAWWARAAVTRAYREGWDGGVKSVWKAANERIDLEIKRLDDRARLIKDEEDAHQARTDRPTTADVDALDRELDRSD